MQWKELLKKPFELWCQKEYLKKRKSCLLSLPELLEQQESEIRDYLKKTAGTAEGELNKADRMTEINKISDDILLFTCAPGKMALQAAACFEAAFFSQPEAALAYCDEAWENPAEGQEDPATGQETPTTGQETPYSVWVKPDWSPDTFLSRFYLGSLIAVRKSLLEQLFNPEELSELYSVPMKSELGSVPGKESAAEIPVYQVSADMLYELCYKIIKIKNGFNKRTNKKNPVIHLPWILYYRSRTEQKAGTASGEENGTGARQLWQIHTGKLREIMETEADPAPQVSVIIPSKDHAALVEQCITTLRHTVTRLAIEILVIDNGSAPEEKKKLEQLAEQLDFTYVYEPMEFNFSRMCNMGAQKAKGKHLLFLNDDVECLEAGWLESMVSVAERPYAGAVGCKLLYPDGETLQHAGVVNLPMGPVHKLCHLSDAKEYYDAYNRGIRNVLAVTGACLMVQKEVFLSCGGMEEQLQVAFNDVELCFRLYEQGYYNAIVQDVRLIHHESVSRGEDESSRKWNRLMRERDLLYALHPELVGKDPFYSYGLNHRGLDVRILPEYRMGKEQLQQCDKPLPAFRLPTAAREDACFLVRFESVRNQGGQIELHGYGVILGSDNACYKKELLLQEVLESSSKEQTAGKFYRLPIQEQYRYDLEQNMRDQKHVAMSGFSVILKENVLAPGTYRLGLYAKQRTGGIRLYQMTTRSVTINGK